MNATDRRFAAIKAVSDATVTTTKEGNTFHGTRTEIAARIREIAKLGRTERWADAVEAWAEQVEDTEWPLEHAFLQWSVYAGMAA